MTRVAIASAPPPADDAAAQWRLTSRLAVSFLLDSIAIFRRGGDILDTLLASAIIQANVEEIARRADLQVAFAQGDAPPPDDLRRPVSMNALANSLQLPFETVRRRVRGLVRDGHCVFVDGGVIVPGAVLARPRFHVDGLRGFERMRRFYHALSDRGLLPDLPPPTVQLAPDALAVRIVARLAGSYVLRVVEARGEMGDLIDALVLLETYRSNCEPSAEHPWGGAGPKPVSVARVAARISLPPETVRRHVNVLARAGACVRVRGGVIVPPETVDGQMRAALEVNVNDLRRLFGALSRLGVLQVWDAARSPAARAATAAWPPGSPPPRATAAGWTPARARTAAGAPRAG